MKSITRRRLARRKRKIQHRLREIHWEDQPKPMLGASNIHYELAERSGGLAVGGIGLMHRVARRTGLIEALEGIRFEELEAGVATP